jgi:sensor histidine kinase regulating citrate/malate metabolism
MKKTALTAILLLLQVSVFGAMQDTSPDARISLNFTPEEKAEFLSEMRQMLASIQGIISGIAEENPDKIIHAARYSGNRMARTTPMSIKNKTPQRFKDIGGPTHMMFEELVIRAETDDMQTLTELTGQIMQQCIACHAIYRAN